MIRQWLARSYLVLIYALLYTPLIVLVIFSFNDAQYSGLWHGFTGRWYQVLWQDQHLHTIVEHSIVIGFLAATLGAIIGALGAFALYKYRFLGKRLVLGLILVLIIVPDLVMGVSLLLLFHFLHLGLGFATLLLAHVTFCIPFVVVLVSNRLADTDTSLIEAAKDLGATDQMIFWRIMLPIMGPALFAGWCLSFTLSFDDVIISTFVSGPSFQILPLYIFNQVKLGETGELNALCSLILLVTLSLAIITQLVRRRRCES